jgi:single-strand DNA-binding protein
MSTINRVIILGNLGADPETRYLTNGDAVTSIRVATSENWKDGSGQRVEKTEWHTIVLFKRLAEVASEYLRKGSKVYVEGKIQTRTYESQDGVTKYVVEIRADSMKLMGDRQDKQGEQPRNPSTGAPRQQRNAPARQQPSAPSGGFDDDGSDIPF